MPMRYQGQKPSCHYLPSGRRANHGYRPVSKMDLPKPLHIRTLLFDEAEAFVCYCKRWNPYPQFSFVISSDS
ncbi:hypothetical protein AR158_c453L [Paramecium bursaria Chlorella virus AR158]|uniref:hypothetical protein n=1 Tax=Paramecium bursaria Chlorella virus AR158 TaxID=380598 RepID=UPI00015AA6E7|nr:hypothetical protein AR158_c453L [Paramecium bursaria Chlorella virus AR158]ABU43998.1 hypothetical protein AR158_c453L [Paramecium bursaria Chlorella virus AR158]